MTDASRDEGGGVVALAVALERRERALEGSFREVRGARTRPTIDSVCRIDATKAAGAWAAALRIPKPPKLTAIEARIHCGSAVEKAAPIHEAKVAHWAMSSH